MPLEATPRIYLFRSSWLVTVQRMEIADADRRRCSVKKEQVAGIARTTGELVVDGQLRTVGSPGY